MSLPAALVGVLSALGGSLITAGSNLLIGRLHGRTERFNAETSRMAAMAEQLQAQMASANYWQGQYQRQLKETELWQNEASDWHERFYRGLTDLRVLGQAQQTVHNLAQQQLEKGQLP